MMAEKQEPGRLKLFMEKKNLYRFIYPIFSFLIPAVIILGALAGLKVTPFGDNSLVISDGNGLYINYMGYVSRAIRGQDGILYSFTKGLGGNMAGSWGWFLLNPTFALFAFADVTNYMQVYTLVSVLNFCLCGLTMYICLKDIYGHRLSNLIFSTAYAMNGFLVANVFQLNFFVVIPVLPLMVMGLRRVLKGGSPVVYTLSIAYALLTNFYFGFMVCVASFLIFVVCFIAERNQIENKSSVVIRYAISSVLGGGLSAVVWLPALLSLRGGRLDQSVANVISFKENMPFLDMFSKLFIGANSTSELSNGLPNIFVGILPVFLVIMFFMNKKIPARKKIAAATLLIFYLVSFYIVVFNMAMHGGTVTNWFNYRDSFIFCFLMIFIAAEEWQYFTEEPGDNIKKALVVFVVASLIVFNKKYDYVSGGMVLLDLCILALMLGAYTMHKKDPVKNPMRALTMVVLVMTSLDLYLNYYFSVKNIMEWQRIESEYQQVTFPVSALVDAIKASDKDFYRMEVGEQRSETTGNDPMLYGYYGVGHGGSDDRDFVRLALSELGVHRLDMRNSYGRGVTSATDSLLGIRYVISKEDLETWKGYEKRAGLSEYSIYENNNALPVAMVVDEKTEEVPLDIEDIFNNLNLTWSAMTGCPDKIFIEEEDAEFSSHNITDPLTLTGEKAAEIVSSRDAGEKTDEGEDSTDADSDSQASASSQSIPDENWSTLQEEPENINYIKFSFTADRDGAVYTYNRSGMTEDNGSYPHALNYEGCFHKGDTVTGFIHFEGAAVNRFLLEEVAGRFKAVYMDESTLSAMSRTILERPSSVTKISDTHLMGTFTAQEGQKLMFTIPYDEGWTLYIDGEKRNLDKVLDVFMAADAGPGEHTYEMKFVPIGLKAGGIVTGVSLLLSFILLMIQFLPIKRLL